MWRERGKEEKKNKRQYQMKREYTKIKMRAETEWNESGIWIDNDAGMWGYMDIKKEMWMKGVIKMIWRKEKIKKNT